MSSLPPWVTATTFGNSSSHSAFTASRYPCTAAAPESTDAGGVVPAGGRAPEEQPTSSRPTASTARLAGLMASCLVQDCRVVGTRLLDRVVRTEPLVSAGKSGSALE